ncbi:uncharacterized protein JCM6883_002117 [Sporobolomyces salmoneus]|uniref:uncharacterized protein n=1 Tax=Sporobolomyces salmoneus TaxID=183962 RepID=UPI003176DFF6
MASNTDTFLRFDSLPCSPDANRLAGLPKIPKLKKAKKSTKSTKSTPRSPPKPASKPVAPAPPPSSSGPSSTSAAAPPASSFPIELSDDDTLSELESSSEESSSEDSDDSSDESDSDEENEEQPAVPALPSLSSLVLPPLPPLPPLPTSLPTPVASTSKASLPVKSSSATKKSHSALPTASLVARPKSFKPFNATTTPLPSPAPSKPQSPAQPPSQPQPSASSSTSKPVKAIPSSMTSPSDLAYSPSNTTPRSTIGAPQRMSLRQVLALSLQEAEDQQKNSSRENTPDANEIMNLAKGKKNKDKSKRKENGNGNGTGKKDGNESDSSLSTVTSAASSSDSEMELDDGVGDAENDLGNMEKEEEKLLRAELEAKKKKSSILKGKGKAVMDPPITFGGNQDDVDMDEETEDDEEDDEMDNLKDAWDQNVRAMEQIRRKRNQSGSGGGDISFDRQSDGDSDVAITDLPPGNGFGVVTWSDYDSFGSEEEDDGAEDGVPKELEEDQLAEVLLAEKTGIAGEFEKELEQLFALSEAVVGPIRHDEYEAGDMWFEALSDNDGSTADDESDGEEEDDIDAEMIFGEDGELKKLFGTRKKRRYSAVDSSAGETDSDGDEEATESEDDRDVELVRVGVHLDEKKRRRREGQGEGEGDGVEEESETESESENEETDSSCSDTDIYRYAPRTGALANLQAPTTADLASLEEPTPSTSSSSTRPKPPFAPSRHNAPSTLEVPAFDHVKGKAKAKLPTFRRRLPKMGTFDTTERKQQASESESTAPKIVIVGSGDELAPSPFRVPSKKTKRQSVTSPRRARSDSRISTTSGTSGSTSLDPGSNFGSPVLGNVVFPEFDLESLLQDSVFDATDNEDAGGGTSSETDTGAVTSQPPPDFSRWSRIPIGAFRSRTMGASGRHAPSQVLTAQAAATELRKNRNKRRNSSSTLANQSDQGRKRSSSRRGSEDEVASSILRDHKAVKSSLRHTLGGSPPRANGKKRKTIRSRMLTSPVLAPTLPSTKPSSSSSTSLAAVAAAVFNKNKKKKRSNRSKSPADASTSSRLQSRQNSTVPPPASSAPSANLLPLPPALFPKSGI